MIEMFCEDDQVVCGSIKILDRGFLDETNTGVEVSGWLVGWCARSLDD